MKDRAKRTIRTAQKWDIKKLEAYSSNREPKPTIDINN
jgi:hypothetical protein